MPIPVDMSMALNSATMTVTIKPTRMWLLRLRLLLGIKFIWLGARVMGCGEIKILLEDSDG